MSSISFGKIKLGPQHPPLVVAEAGVNHNGSITTALKLVDAAKACGAHIVKFQNFSAEKLVRTGAPKAAYQISNTKDPGQSQLDMLKKLELDHGMTREIKTHCDALGIAFLSTPYDPENVLFLASLGVSAIKIGSGDMVDYRMHDAIRETGLPLIQGLGMSTEDEVRALVDDYYNHDPDYPLVLLQCTSNYPARAVNSNIRYISTLQRQFSKAIPGFSDHTRNSASAVLALAMGAKLFEKHFTLDRAMPGPDHAASCNPTEMKEYVHDILLAEKILGSGHKSIANEEADTRNISRKGAYLNCDLPAGAVVLESHLDFMRPAGQYPVSLIRPCVGKHLKIARQKGQQLKPADFQD